MAQETVNLYLVKSGYTRADYPTTVYQTNSSTIYPCNLQGIAGTGKHLFLGFSSLSASLKNRRIYNVQMRVQCDPVSIHAYACKTDFNPATLCWNNEPEPFYDSSQGWLAAGTSPITFADRWLTPSPYYQSFASALFLKTCACYLEGTTDNGAKIVLENGTAPYLEVTYDSSVNVKSKIIKRSAPSSGYVNPRNATSFSWAFERDSTEEYYCAGVFTQSSAALKWKTSGGSWNTINASGSTQSITVPANTFPTASTIEWYLTGTDTAGTTSETEHYSFSTAAGTAYANPSSPVNSVEDGSKVITFRWTLSSTDGQTPIYVDFQAKTASASSWTSIWSKHAATTSCNVVANYFSAGEIQWRIRAYNVDDVDGPWSSINSFICVAAPTAPQGLQATEVPRTNISWQSTGQEAYEIEIDGVSFAKTYSTTTSRWQLYEPLEDGEHTIRVRIQGVYGLWSDWSSVVIDVANIPPNTLTLTGQFAIDAELQVDISTHPSNPYVHWYRDGIRIARTHGPVEFTDRTVLGEHSWYAEMWFDSGYYSRSNTVTGELKSCVTRIAAVDYGSPWLILKLSENSDSVQSFSWLRMSSLRHVRGLAYPVLELGESEDLTGTYDCAFKTVQEARQFESLKGKVVIIKSRGGEVLIGALTKMSKRMKDFYITYSFSVQQINWEGMVYYDTND